MNANPEAEEFIRLKLTPTSSFLAMELTAIGGGDCNCSDKAF